MGHVDHAPRGTAWTAYAAKLFDFVGGSKFGKACGSLPSTTLAGACVGLHHSLIPIGVQASASMSPNVHADGHSLESMDKGGLYTPQSARTFEKAVGPTSWPVRPSSSPRVVLIYPHHVSSSPCAAPRLAPPPPSFTWQVGPQLEVAKKDARKFYLSTPKPKLDLFTSMGGATRHLAVHVRRGDIYNAWRTRAQVPMDAIQKARWVDDSKVLSCIEQSLKLMGGNTKQIAVHIFSEGQLDDFAAFSDSTSLGASSAGVQLHLDTGLMSTFHHMVMADGLVEAPSMLSGAAWHLRDASTTYGMCNSLGVGRNAQADWELDVESGRAGARAVEMVGGRSPQGV